MAMTQKQMILAAARGERLEQLPFGARIDTWYNYHKAHDTLPEKYKGWTQTNILRDLGAGAQYRLFSVVREEFRDMEVIETSDPPITRTEFRTPFGSVYKGMRFNPYEGAWLGYESEKPFKSEKDYPIIKYVLEHTVPVNNFEAYDKLCEEVGEDGMVMTTGFRPWSAPQRVMREIMGYETFFYELMDHPAQVEELIEVAKDLERRAYEVSLKSGLELFNICSNWSDDIHTPVFRKYFTPWLREITDLLHSHGKLAMAHIDGEDRRLIPLLPETNIDVWEAWTPSPMTSVTNAEMKQAIGDGATIWGGIPATLFEPEHSDEEFEDYIVNHVFREIAPGYRFIVGMGDNLPFDGKIERVRRVVELVDQFGKLPIEL